MRALAFLPLLGGCFLVLDYDGYEDSQPVPGDGGGGTSSGMGMGGDGGCEEACYTGPPATRGVGLCRGSVAACATEECVGEVLPATETCADGFDEDCDGARCDPWTWLRRYGDAGDQVVAALAADEDRVVVGGWQDGTLDLGGPPPLTSPGSFIAMLTVAGEPLWLAGASGEHPAAVALDGALGHVTVAGEREGSPVTGFVRQLDREDGMPVGGSVELAGSGDTRVTAVGAGAGYTLLAGTFAGDLSVNGVPLTTPGTRDVLFVKLGPGLVFLGGNTIRSFGGAGDDEAHALAVAGDLVVVAGRYEGVMTFPESVPDLPDAGGEADAFVVALDTTTGEVAWGHGLQGDAGPGWAGAVAADRGGVVVAGAMRGTTDFAGDGSSPRGPADGLDAFVARYTAAGELAWVARIGGPGDQQASGAVVEGGFVYVAGRFDTVADFDPDTPGDSVPAGALEDVFLAKLGAAGELVWLTRYAVAGVGSDPRVAPGPVLAGSWRGQLDFRGTDGALSTTAEDAFVARFATR